MSVERKNLLCSRENMRSSMAEVGCYNKNDAEKKGRGQLMQEFVRTRKNKSFRAEKWLNFSYIENLKCHTLKNSTQHFYPVASKHILLPKVIIPIVHIATSLILASYNIPVQKILVEINLCVKYPLCRNIRSL